MQIIDSRKLLVKVAQILDELKISYFITVGFAVSVWGRPRSTVDIDIVVNLFEPQLKSLVEALKKVSKLGYLDEDTAKEALQNKGEFNFIDPESGLKVDFWITKDDERAAVEFKRKVPRKIDSHTVYFISPEDLILNKLIWHKKGSSTRHLEDTETIFQKSKNLDIEYLKRWAEQLGVSEEFKKLISIY